MDPHVAEVRAVIKVLSEGWASPEAGAEAVIRALDEARIDRTLYAVAVNAKPAPIIYHTFGTRQEALKWVKDSAVDVLGLDVWVLQMFSKNRPLERHTSAAHDRLMNQRGT